MLPSWDWPHWTAKKSSAKKFQIVLDGADKKINMEGMVKYFLDSY